MTGHKIPRPIGQVIIVVAVLIAVGLTVGRAVTERPDFAPVCSLMADGADSPSYDGHMAALVESYGPLDYVGDSKTPGHGYGSLRTMSGVTVGYRSAEDSDTWSDPSCLTFRSVPESK